MKSVLKGIWRLVQPLRFYLFKYPLKIWSAYFLFYKNWRQYKELGGKASFRYIAPVLRLNEDNQTGGGHYFYQDIWALKKLALLKPAMHYDIGSRYDGFVGQATAICPVTSVDIRPPSFQLPDYHFIQGDIMKLPFQSDSLNTLSCLHTIEHIGLGRYGDPIAPNGFYDALSELSRVVAKGGYFILSMPIGKERIEFNAQRILNPLTCINHLPQMKLLEFSVVNDQDAYLENVNPADYVNDKYSCGLFLFQKQ